ncbi:MAG: response regulator [Candidatus Polarisedimenticolia bacterium]
MDPADSIAVAIVEDRAETREGLAALIAGTPGFRCTGAYRSIEEALPRFDDARPHVALMDIHLPGISGIEGIRRLKPRFPDTVFLVLSVYDDDERIFEALCAGASGYLLKKTPPARLLEALRDAAAGGGPLSPEVAQRVIHLFREFRPPEKSQEELTPHEVRILKLISEGHDYPSAAAELGVATSTVIYHMRQIFSKLQVHSKSEAVAKALRTRLLR